MGELELEPAALLTDSISINLLLTLLFKLAEQDLVPEPLQVLLNPDMKGQVFGDPSLHPMEDITSRTTVQYRWLLPRADI